MSLEDWEAKMVDSCNRSLRTALHKNVVEQSNCDSTTRTLDAQKRWVHSRLTKEERELRQQLHLLQLEQKHLSEQPSAPDAVFEVAAVTADAESCVLDPDEVVNPYPITSRSKHNSSGTGNHYDQSTGGSSLLQAPRGSRNVIDLETVGRLWVGDLEAISSIRRGLKPPCRQRLDQQIWARSKSLKERPQSSALNRCFAMSRSKSLRDPSDKIKPSPAYSETGSPRSSVPCSRSGSLKGLSPRKSDPCHTIDPALHRSLSLKSKIFAREQSLDFESNALGTFSMELGHPFGRPRLSTPNLAISDLVPLPPIATSDPLPSSTLPHAPTGSNASQECYAMTWQTVKTALGKRTSVNTLGKCEAARGEGEEGDKQEGDPDGGSALQDAGNSEVVMK